MEERVNKMSLNVSFLQETAAICTSRQHSTWNCLRQQDPFPSCLTALDGGNVGKQQSDNEHPNSQTWADNQITQFTHILELPADSLQVHYHCSKTQICLLLLLYNMLIIKLYSEENADGRNLKIRKLHNDPDGKGDNSLRRSERRSQAEQNICCLLETTMILFFFFLFLAVFISSLAFMEPIGMEEKKMVKGPLGSIWSPLLSH